MPKETVVVMVNNQQILVQGRIIADVAKVMLSEKVIIKELLDEMAIQSQNSWTPANVEEGLEVTVMGDRHIPYKLLRKILATLSQANYTNISMAVSKRPESKNDSSTDAG